MGDLYLCDPEKNHSCRGYKGPGWCGIICFCTTEKEKSLTGKPLKAGEYEQEQEKRIYGYEKEAGHGTERVDRENL